MADISGYIRIINEAEKGEAVRDAITGALEEMNTYGGNASTLENHPASYFATATFFTAVAEQVGEVDDVLIAIENGLNALKYDMGEFTLSGSGGSFTVDCTGIKGYDNLDVSKFYFEILGGSDATQAGNWTPTQSYNQETGIFSYSWGALSSNINVKLWIIKPTHAAAGVQVQPLVITENGNWDAGANAAYNPVTIRVPNVIDVRKLTQSITKNGVFTFTPEPNTGFSEVTVNVEVPMPREKVIVNQTFTENGTYRAIDEEPVADGYGIVTVNVDQKIIADEKTITANGTYDSIDEGLDGYEKVIVDVDPEAALGHKTIGQNGTYNAEDDDLDGYSSVNVVVPQQVLGSKTITSNGTYDPLDEDPKLDGFNSVTVNVPQTPAVLGSKTITENGTYDPEDDNFDGFNSVTVNVPQTPAILGSKTITENGIYDPEDDNFDGYNSVIVNVSGGGGGGGSYKPIYFDSVDGDGRETRSVSQDEFTCEFDDIWTNWSVNVIAITDAIDLTRVDKIKLRCNSTVFNGDSLIRLYITSVNTYTRGSGKWSSLLSSQNIRANLEIDEDGEYEINTEGISGIHYIYVAAFTGLDKGAQGNCNDSKIGAFNGVISLSKYIGDEKISSGTFVSANSQYGIVNIDCGFEPDFVIVSLPFSGGDTTSYWWREASWGAEKAIWELRPAEQNTYVNDLNRSSGETGIQAINSNGFSFMSNGGNTRGITCKYFACKYS